MLGPWWILRFCPLLIAVALGFQTAAAQQQALPEGSEDQLGNCIQTEEGRLCGVQQKIIAGKTVPVETQRYLGLVRLDNVGCSGTLLNQYWVLTADHCISDKHGPSVDFRKAQVSAAWTTNVGIPTRFVRSWWASRG